ncbi:MAG: hypothetical protein HQL31_08440 [Planctomycetes bacterium]|nr:hypothetical protein [Planctomycetota bacterium]
MNYNQRFSAEELYAIRNQIPLRNLMQTFEIHTKIIEGYWRFVCPICGDMNTAINPNTNLGRCFRCQKNFNTIDIAMITRHSSFRQAVMLLREIRGAIHLHQTERK